MIKNGHGKTALHYAVKKGNEELVVLLVRSGADLGRRDYQKKTPLDYAIQYGQTHVIPKLVPPEYNEQDLLANGYRDKGCAVS